MGAMKTIATFAEEHGFDADDVKDFAAEWMPVVDTDWPLWGVLHSYRVMEENGIHERDTEAFMDYLAICAWDVEEAGSQFGDAYSGQWESLEEYARQSIDDHGYIGLKTERTGEEVWVSFRDVQRFCRENDLKEPQVDLATWETNYTISRNGHVFESV
ncbi:Antirestriction protein (ArdA) [Streptomyces yunnanensis]|uniref:Antirestriction protein (ArdA) n=2 Tax=Streptomyces yunnanensis TaxID=156453 RepID=A0A9X8N7V5_9ACTN|nr:Antirestriction protein (ArdA) [Streptomyces yunnanensis]